MTIVLVISWKLLKIILFFSTHKTGVKNTGYLNNVSFRSRWKIMTISQGALQSKWNLLRNHFPDQSVLSIKTHLNCPLWACCSYLYSYIMYESLLVAQTALCSISDFPFHAKLCNLLVLFRLMCYYFAYFISFVIHAMWYLSIGDQWVFYTVYKFVWWRSKSIKYITALNLFWELFYKKCSLSFSKLMTIFLSSRIFKYININIWMAAFKLLVIKYNLLLNYEMLVMRVS